MSATTPTTNPTTTPRYPLGWLRALAAFAVVFFHAYQHHRYGAQGTWPWDGLPHRLMTGTDLFVDMFFVLSGLVLWLPIARAALDGNTDKPGRVLLYRRMARLVPLYFAVVLIVWTTTNPELPGHWVDLLTHLTFTHVYSDDYIFWTNGPAWSLGVEFHFYVLMALAVPLVHQGVRRTGSRRARTAVAAVLPAVLVVVGLGYLGWATQLSGEPHTNWSIWFSPLAKAADFGIGMGLAVLAAAGVRAGRAVRGLATALCVAALVVLVLARPDTIAGEWWHPAYALAIAVGLSAVVLHDGPWPAALDWRPLAWLGGLGYGIYLIHEPVMRLLGSRGLLPDPGPGPTFVWTAVLVAVPTVALAWLSSRTIEAAGLKLLAMIDRRGRPRDYYAHLEDSPRTEEREDRTDAALAGAR
jgi:peptidoglycan/LPS O-acetylase OafA/YrhL